MSETPPRFQGQRSGTAPSRRTNAVEGIVSAIAVVVLIFVLTPLLPDSNVYAPVLAAALVIIGVLIARRVRR